MLENEKCIQSYLPHAMRFEKKEMLDVGIHEDILLIPAGHVEKNIVIVADEVLTRLAKDPTFKAIVDAKLIRILEAVPAKYQDQTETLIKARVQLDDAKQKATDAEAKNAALDAENEALKKRIAELENGSDIKSIDPAKMAAAKAAADSLR
jgi:hypothetical protein